MLRTFCFFLIDFYRNNLDFLNPLNTYKITPISLSLSLYLFTWHLFLKFAYQSQCSELIQTWLMIKIWKPERNVKQIKIKKILWGFEREKWDVRLSKLSMTKWRMKTLSGLITIRWLRDRIKKIGGTQSFSDSQTGIPSYWFYREPLNYLTFFKISFIISTLGSVLRVMTCYLFS